MSTRTESNESTESNEGDDLTRRRDLARLRAEIRDTRLDMEGRLDAGLAELRAVVNGEINDLGVRVAGRREVDVAIAKARDEMRAEVVEKLNDTVSGIRADVRGQREETGGMAAVSVGVGVSDLRYETRRMRELGSAIDHWLADLRRGLIDELNRLRVDVEADDRRRSEWRLAVAPVAMGLVGIALFVVSLVA